MVTAIMWMQKFVGRAESKLPFSISAYLHLTTDFFLSKWRTFIRNQCPGDSEKSATESWPSLRWVPEQTASVDGGSVTGMGCAGTIHAFPVESHISSRSAGSVSQMKK